jgi:hypothetical protein
MMMLFLSCINFLSAEMSGVYGYKNYFITRLVFGLSTMQNQLLILCKKKNLEISDY